MASSLEVWDTRISDHAEYLSTDRQNFGRDDAGVCSRPSDVQIFGSPYGRYPKPQADPCTGRACELPADRVVSSSPATHGGSERGALGSTKTSQHARLDSVILLVKGLRSNTGSRSSLGLPHPRKQTPNTLSLTMNKLEQRGV